MTLHPAAVALTLVLGSSLRKAETGHRWGRSAQILVIQSHLDSPAPRV